MRTPVGIVVLAVAAFAVAGCGASERHGPQAASAGAPLSQPAPDAQRAQDLVPLTTAQAAGRRSASRSSSRAARAWSRARRARRSRARRSPCSDVLKGRLPRAFVVQVIGGRLGDTVVASPVQAFGASRRYILFLGPDGPAGPTIFPQAVLEVKRAGGADVVAPRPTACAARRLGIRRESRGRAWTTSCSRSGATCATGGSPMTRRRRTLALAAAVAVLAAAPGRRLPAPRRRPWARRCSPQHWRALPIALDGRQRADRHLGRDRHRDRHLERRRHRAATRGAPRPGRRRRRQPGGLHRHNFGTAWGDLTGDGRQEVVFDEDGSALTRARPRPRIGQRLRARATA